MVGLGRAKELILTGDMITAQEAARLGLVNKVVPSGQVVKAAQDLARKIISKSAMAIAAILKAINHGMEVSLLDALKLEEEEFVELCGTHDAYEGVTAFLEKRQPKFKDK